MCYSGVMDLLSVIGIFDQAVPVGIVAILIMQALQGRDIKHLNKEIISIKETLNNHITETNKRIDRLSDRIDKLSDQFNRLYETLWKDRQQK